MGKGERLARVKILLLAVLLAVVAITSALRLNDTVYDASQRFYGYLREGQSAEAWGMLAAEAKQKIAPGDITSLEAALEAFERTGLLAPTGKNGFFKAVRQGSEAVFYWKRGFSGWRVAYMSPGKIGSTPVTGSEPAGRLAPPVTERSSVRLTDLAIGYKRENGNYREQRRVDTDGSHDLVVVRNGFGTWSPGGDKIALNVVTLVVGGGTMNPESLWIKDLLSGEEKLVVYPSGIDGPYLDPLWIDNQHLLAGEGRVYQPAYYIIGPEGRVPFPELFRPIGKFGNGFWGSYRAHFANWQPGGKMRIWNEGLEPVRVHASALSPDGKTIAFFREQNDLLYYKNNIAYHDYPLYLLDTGSGVERNLPARGDHLWWSPDSRYLAVLGREGIIITEVATETVVDVIPGRFPYNQLMWHPSGEYFVYEKDPNPGDGRPYPEKQELWRWDLKSNETSQLVPPHAPYMGEPAWSPDGRYLLYSAGKQHYRSIYLWDAAANKSYRVTTPETNDHHSKPQWVTRAEGLLVATSAPPQRQVSIRLAPFASMETSLEGGGPPYHWINKRYQWAKDGSFFALTTPFFSLIDSQGKTRNFNFGARMARISPDGRQVAIVDGTGLAVMDLGTEKQRQLIASGQGETIRTAAWSYTGNSVFVVTGKAGNPDATDVLERVEICTGRRQTVFSGQVVWTMQMIRVEIYPSPTADDLALAIGETVWILPAGSEKPRLVSRSPAYNPAWSPDGKFLAFQEQVLKDRDYAIKVVDHTGLNLIEVGEGNNPQWLGNDTLVHLDNYDKRVMAIPSGGGIPTKVLQPLPGEKIVAIATSSSGGRLAVLLERTGEKNRLDFYSMEK